MTYEEALRSNREKKRAYIKEQIRLQKRKERKETILATIIGIFILVTTVLLLDKMNNNFMTRCTAAGHSVSYCERGLYDE